eukprot:TRINITY_DN16718_c0_g1_i1.p1 TRINITY_DN16718_c0_g1~~TRINITY_DN16718_c0_g1_i1.p1  ORF type:complete len:256 (+),score=15.52 TRINITY_DN16718_c0_g1_i1:21-788(+)
MFIIRTFGCFLYCFFFFQAEDGIRDHAQSRGLGDVYKRQILIIQILKIARKARDKFGEFICVGMASYILFAATQNIGMTLGLLPITGITLPFISYGGSSLWTTMISMALILNIEISTKKLAFSKSNIIQFYIQFNGIQYIILLEQFTIHEQSINAIAFEVMAFSSKYFVSNILDYSSQVDLHLTIQATHRIRTYGVPAYDSSQQHQQQLEQLEIGLFTRSLFKFLVTAFFKPQNFFDFIKKFIHFIKIHLAQGAK